VAQIVEHKRNVSATAGAIMRVVELRNRLASIPSDGKSHGPLVSLSGFKIWNDSSVGSTVRPAAFVFPATTVKVRAFSLNCSFRAQVISFGSKTRIDHEAPNVVEIAPAGFIDDLLCFSEIRPQSAETDCGNGETSLEGGLERDVEAIFR